MSMNYREALAQLEAALAAYDSAVSKLHGDYCEGRNGTRTALNGELVNALLTSVAGNALGRTNLDAQELLLDVAAGNGKPCKKVIATTVAGIDARIEALNAQRQLLDAARKALDARFDAADAAARAAREQLCALSDDKK